MPLQKSPFIMSKTSLDK